jgi:hypothetical protein
MCHSQLLHVPLWYSVKEARGSSHVHLRAHAKILKLAAKAVQTSLYRCMAFSFDIIVLHQPCHRHLFTKVALICLLDQACMQLHRLAKPARFVWHLLSTLFAAVSYQKLQVTCKPAVLCVGQCEHISVTWVSISRYAFTKWCHQYKSCAASVRDSLMCPSNLAS